MFLVAIIVFSLVPRLSFSAPLHMSSVESHLCTTSTLPPAPGSTAAVQLGSRSPSPDDTDDPSPSGVIEIPAGIPERPPPSPVVSSAFHFIPATPASVVEPTAPPEVSAVFIGRAPTLRWEIPLRHLGPFAVPRYASLGDAQQADSDAAVLRGSIAEEA